MAGDIISKKTRYAFREYFVGWTLREIRMEFDACDVPCDNEYVSPESGERRSLVEQYYHVVDFAKWADVRRVVKVYESALAHIERRIEAPLYGDTAEGLKRLLESLTNCLARDGFAYQGGQIVNKRQVATLPAVRDAAAALDVPELHRQLERLRVAVDDDPSLAIGTAKELVETTCKTILHARGVDVDENADIGELMKATRQVLGLLPNNVPNAAKGAEVIKRVLSNLGSVAQGLGELRNLYGTGHGRTGSARGLSPRHARLAVGSASALAAFLLETHEERSPKHTT